MSCKFSVDPSDMVKVTVVDSLNDNPVIASTTVPLGSDITSWLKSLTVPTHDGYNMIDVEDWEITAGSITSVNDNATVYIRYQATSGGDSEDTNTGSVVMSMNSDGDLFVQKIDSPISSGEATIKLKMTHNLGAVDCSYVTVKKNSTGEVLENTVNNNGISEITFTDDSIDTQTYYIISAYDSDNNKIANALWQCSLKPRSMTITQGDNTVELTIRSNTASTSVNEDGDISVEDVHLIDDNVAGEATVYIKMSKSFDKIKYASYNVAEFSKGDDEEFKKENVVISGDTITFTDKNIATRNSYAICLLDANKNRLGQLLWDAGFKPVAMTITLKNGKEYKNIYLY